MARYEDQIGRLGYRMPINLKALHYLITAEGAYCLDLNLHAVSCAALDQAVVVALEKLHFSEVMPSAPDEMWWRLTRAPHRLPIRLLSVLAGQRRPVFIASASEVADAG